MGRVTMSSRPAELMAGEILPEEELRPFLAGCGSGVRVFRGSRLVGAERIRIGDASQIDEGVWLFAGLGIEIGRHVHFAFGSSVSGGGRCVLGDYVSIGAGVRLVTGSDDIAGRGLTNPTIPPESRSVSRGRVEIGSHAVIFTGCIVLPGVTVGEGAVVGAGSLVHHDLKPWGIYAGQPLVQVGVRPDGEIRALAARLEKVSQ